MVRLDIWLDVACIFKTRSEAQRAIKGGKVEVNGQSAKPHREVKAGDVVNVTRAHGRKQRLLVLGLAEQHVSKADARTLYEDTTPPPSAEERALIDLLKLAGPRRRIINPVTPDRREKRRLRRLKEGHGPDE